MSDTCPDHGFACRLDDLQERVDSLKERLESLEEEVERAHANELIELKREIRERCGGR